MIRDIPNGGPRYFTSHGEDGFVVYANPQSICWGINTIFGDFEHARWMGERGRGKAAYGFSWDAVASHVYTETSIRISRETLRRWATP